MERGLRWVQKLADGADLHGESIPGVPVVELAGNRRVLIECHGGVTQYSREMICVKVSYGHVCVIGRNLELTLMTKMQLVISGDIQEVRLQGREKS